MEWATTVRILPLLVLAILLIAAAVEDLCVREIGDRKTIAVAMLAPAWWWVSDVEPWPGLAIQLALALGVFALFAGAFAAGAMGGGDVKLISALALWFPWPLLVQLLFVMSLAGGAVTLAMLAARWRARDRIEVPYGIAIAAAGLLMLREPLLNQLG